MSTTPFASLAEARERLERNGHSGIAEYVNIPANLISAADLISQDAATYQDDEGRELADRLRATAEHLTRS